MVFDLVRSAEDLAAGRHHERHLAKILANLDRSWLETIESDERGTF